MNKTILASLVGAILILGVGLSPLLTQQVANAKDIIQHCDAKNLKCEFNTEFEKVNGKVNLKQFFDFSGIGSGSGGGGGNGSANATDQQARDRITALENENVQLKNTNDAQDSLISELKANFSSASNEAGILTDRVNQQADVINTLIENVSNLQTQVDNAITDVNSNESGGVVTPIPPSGNQTGNQTGGGDNQTGGVIVTPPTNETGNVTTPTEPPAENGTGTNSTNSSSGVLNFTG